MMACTPPGSSDVAQRASHFSILALLSSTSCLSLPTFSTPSSTEMGVIRSLLVVAAEPPS